ncbi:phosphatidate cytidylyltransferase [Litoribacter populi]|uniref:phosphatidate cytidylyltransferase n=1 Tax=Litoribacter populi TaxID=2598460 RepID=UPI00117D3487|nr:phosphatidate cytidylyltransferase [Litoribacter populi]
MKSFIQNILLIMLALVTLTSCDAIGAIFDVGLGVGIIGTLIVVGIIVLIVRALKK